MLERLFTSSYWLLTDPGPLSAPGRWLYLGLMVLSLAGALAAAGALRRHGSRRVTLAATIACMSALAAAALRWLGLPLARIWTGLPLALGLLLSIVAWLPRPVWPLLWQGWADLWAFQAPEAQKSEARTRGGSTLTLALPLRRGREGIMERALHQGFPPPPQGEGQGEGGSPTSARPALAATLLAALHLFALAFTARLAGWPVRYAAVLWLILLALPAMGRIARRRCPLPALNALLPAYAFAAIAAVFPRLPLRPLLLPVTVILAGYALAYQVYGLWPARRRAVLAWAPAALLGIAGLAWAVWAYGSLYARGVTGSDPYCYVQMAVDFARHGTFLHRFPLVELAQRLGIDPEPLWHIGYREPLTAAGWAPTVWPTGHSFLLGLLGRLAGEQAIYLGTPLLGLLSAAATAWLAAELVPGAAPRRWWAGAVAAAVVLTSYEQVRWLLVHMADISAQLFSVLTVLLAWRGARRGRAVEVVLAGLALAMAYWTRHTQLAMAVPAVAALAISHPAATGKVRPESGRRLGPAWARHPLPRAIGLYLGAALLGALPDLAYHGALFGSWLRPESKELALYSLRAIPAMTALLVRGWLAAPEFLFLAPFLLLGAWRLWRLQRGALAVLALWLLALWAVQAPYASLRLRDLLPALPVLAVLAAWGSSPLTGAPAGRPNPLTPFPVREGGTVGNGALLPSMVPPSRTGKGVRGLGLLFVLAFWLRTTGTLALPATRAFNNFGYLWPTQRAEIAALRDVTPADAVIGATLNSGAVELYAGRTACLPADWPADEWQRLANALWAQGRPLYLLADGEELEAVLAAAPGYARLTPVATLRRIPYFAADGGSVNRDVVLYRLEPR